MTYTTKQQRSVLQCLERHAGAMSAAEVADALRTGGEPVGLATIYRQLDRLAQQGVIHRVNTGSGAVYQHCSHPGEAGCFLLKCLGCGRILHPDCDRLREFREHFAAHHQFRIDTRSTVLSGWCGNCAGGEVHP